MGHAITVKDVLVIAGALGFVGLLITGLLVAVALMNPFRSGH